MRIFPPIPHKHSSLSLLGCSRPVLYKFEWLIRARALTSERTDWICPDYYFFFWSQTWHPERTLKLTKFGIYITSSKNFIGWLEVWPADSIALYPAGIPDTWSLIHAQNSVCICIMNRHTKNVPDPNGQSNRKSAILIFAAIFTHF